MTSHSLVGPVRRDHTVAAGGARPVSSRAARALHAALGVVLGVLLLAGCGALPGAAPSAESPAGTSAGAPSAASSPVSSGPEPVRGTTPLAKSTPERVRVPSIGAESSLMSLGLNPDRTVEVPPLERSELAGWYRNFPTPGAKGPAIILGHIDGGGKEGVFYRLQEMRAGQKIYVDRADGTEAEFTVSEVRNFPKDDFPTQRVYGPTSDAQLRLISCGGALNKSARSYEDNVVVFATLTGSSRA